MPALTDINLRARNTPLPPLQTRALRQPQDRMLGNGIGSRTWTRYMCCQTTVVDDSPPLRRLGFELSHGELSAGDGCYHVCGENGRVV
jgi:hypothetical protein